MISLHLTKSDKYLLKTALDFFRVRQVGIGPRRGGQFKQFRKLEHMGLLDYHGATREFDDHLGKETNIPAYSLTEKGACLAMSLS